ncbi:MAG: porin family protein [Bacteroidota bacterium]
MKKIVTLSFFLCLTISAFSQQFRLGLQASPAFTWLNTNDNSMTGDGGNLAFKLGPIGEYYFQENYAFIGGLNLVFGAGGSLEHTFGGNLLPGTAASSNTIGLDSLPAGVDIQYNLQYLEIPFGLKFRTNEIGYFRYFAEIPFYVGVNLQGRGNITGTGIDTDKENIGPDVNAINVSWGIGGGVEYILTENTSLIGALSFQSGFVDVTQTGTQNAANGEQPENSKVTINALNIKIGVMF